MNKFLIFIVILCLTSCGLPYCRRTHLNSSELKWITIYHKNDTVLFYEDQYCDTMVVTDKQIFNKNFISIFDLKACNWLEGENEYNAHASIDFKIKHHDTWWEGFFLIQKCQNDSIICMIDFGGLYSKDVSIPHQTKKIIIRDGLNAEQGLYQKLLGVYEIKWEKEKGLVGFKMKDNHILKRGNMMRKGQY